MTGIVIALQDFHRGGTERVAIDLARLWTEAGRKVAILCGDEAGGLRETVDPRVAVVALDPPVRRGLLSGPAGPPARTRQPRGTIVSEKCGAERCPRSSAGAGGPEH